MEVYIGLDVSLASTTICVIGEKGKIVTEAQVASTPEALVAFMGKLEHEIVAIGLEAGPLSHWLHKGLTDAGFEAVLVLHLGGLGRGLAGFNKSAVSVIDDSGNVHSR